MHHLDISPYQGIFLGNISDQRTISDNIRRVRLKYNTRKCSASYGAPTHTDWLLVEVATEGLTAIIFTLCK